MMTSNDLAGIGSLMIRVGRIQLLIMGAIVVGFVTVGRQFIFLWIGLDFDSSYFVALLLIIPGLISFTLQVAYTTLAVGNNQKYHAIVLLCGAPISVGVSFALVPRFGAIGAAFGVCLGLILCFIAMVVVFQSVVHLNMRSFFSECHLKVLPSILLSLALGYLVNRYIPASSLLTFMPKAALVASLYVVVMWATVMNAYEKQLVLSVMRRIPVIGILR
jgi:O-antigen/teichoic acid export membrane protein